MDKCAFYSIFVSALFDLIHKKKGTCDELCLEDTIKLILPIGWITTGSNYYCVIKQWEEDDMPTKNLTVALLEGLIKIGGDISRGKVMRLQPYTNRPILMKNVNKGLVFLKLCIL